MTQYFIPLRLLYKYEPDITVEVGEPRPVLDVPEPVLDLLEFISEATNTTPGGPTPVPDIKVTVVESTTEMQTIPSPSVGDIAIIDTSLQSPAPAIPTRSISWYTQAGWSILYTPFDTFPSFTTIDSDDPLPSVGVKPNDFVRRVGVTGGDLFYVADQDGVFRLIDATDPDVFYTTDIGSVSLAAFPLNTLVFERAPHQVSATVDSFRYRVFIKLDEIQWTLVGFTNAVSVSTASASRSGYDGDIHLIEDSLGDTTGFQVLLAAPNTWSDVIRIGVNSVYEYTVSTPDPSPTITGNFKIGDIAVGTQDGDVKYTYVWNSIQWIRVNNTKNSIVYATDGVDLVNKLDTSVATFRDLLFTQRVSDDVKTWTLQQHLSDGPTNPPSSRSYLGAGVNMISFTKQLTGTLDPFIQALFATDRNISGDYRRRLELSTTSDTFNVPFAKITRGTSVPGSNIVEGDIHITPSTTLERAKLHVAIHQEIALPGDPTPAPAFTQVLQDGYTLYKVDAFTDLQSVPNPVEGDIGIVLNGDGRSTEGISFFKDGVWTFPIIRFPGDRRPVRWVDTQSDESFYKVFQPTFPPEYDFPTNPFITQSRVTGKMFLVCRIGTNNVPTGSDLIIMMVSNDGGVNWESISGAPDTFSVIATPPTGQAYAVNGAITTDTGRLILFCRQFPNTTTPNRAFILYSDDEGVTFTESPIPGSLGNNFTTFSNRAVYLPDGRLIVSGTVQGNSIVTLISENDGLSFVQYSTVLAGTGFNGDIAESMLLDVGGGTFVIIARMVGSDSMGNHYPFICISRDFGQTWGNNGALTPADVLAQRFGSGFLKFEGDGVSLGVPGDLTRQCLFSAVPIRRNLVDYIIIPYYIRSRNILPSGTEQLKLKITGFSLSEWQTIGMGALDPTLPRELYAGPSASSFTADGFTSCVMGDNPNDLILAISRQLPAGSPNTGPHQVALFRTNLIGDILDQIDGVVPVAPGGGCCPAIRTSITGNTTIAENATSPQEIFALNTGIVVTLPTAAGESYSITIKKAFASGVVTVNANGSDTIDGLSSLVLNDPYQSVTLVAVGTSWYVV